MRDIVGYSLDDPIAALATPFYESALALIRTSGAGSISLLAQAFSKPAVLREARADSLLRGNILAADGSVIDEVVLGVFRAPRSYSGEDSVEIYCHGSLPGIKRILDRLLEVGFRRAEPGEYTLRAFANGRIDLTRAEAVREIIAANTEEARGLALRRLSGALEMKIGQLRTRLTAILAAVEVQLDYAEDEASEDIPLAVDELERIGAEIASLAKTARVGRLYRDGARIALAGRTNAGKSSLFNLLIREERSIVSESHGTTRDYIEERIDLSGIPVLLIDTAGLREAVDEAESEGIARTGKVLGSADLVLYLVDGSIGVRPEDEPYLKGALTAGSVIPVWNKADISSLNVPEGFVRVSARTGEGLSGLIDTLSGALFAGAGGKADSGLAIASERQQRLLERALKGIDDAARSHEAGHPLDVIAPDLRDATDALGEITGEIASADMLDEIFSRFCVGK